MDIVDFREYSLSLPNTEETLPFDDSTLVYKVGGRIFAAIFIERPDHFVVKCDPDRAVLLRDRYWQIRPAWHFNKRHWNDVYFEGLADDFLRSLVRHSYRCVLQGVSPKSLREELCAAAIAEGIDDEWSE